MHKIAVIYDSQTGNTKAMAEAVAEGARKVEGIEVRLKTADEAGADDFLWADGVALGSPCYVGLMSAKLKAFLDTSHEAWSKVDGKIGCAFSSAGGAGGGAELTCLAILTALMNYGFLVFGVPDYVKPGVTLHYGAVAVGRPDETALSACRLLGERLTEHVIRLKPSG
ncbi:MAG: flavodoxin family protein [Armatimonadetes bacterium]|nr:flavodoxin family protein [Armatimonadota bacterium]NIM22911.1 flavodoxin family protein [Armatimonadota bacterium]NIM66783.1 flavodoxin family protein [Armatimonadota bacterium]NIM75325.1 flavodoxin family protein [Armatimonadota bacterium]NIN04971.1 flavodoxin family protein [Armatimonadota bacterium]